MKIKLLLFFFIIIFNQLFTQAHANVLITNGQPAKVGQFPWNVEILLQGKPVTPDTMGGCGGTLIAPRWVLTAAHCAASYFEGFMPQAVIGAVDFSPNDTYEIINVDKIFIHPDFKKYSQGKSIGYLPYDFALLHLVSPSKAKPLPLIASTKDAVLIGKNAITIGWGNTGSGLSKKLMFVDVPINPASSCEDLYKRENEQWFNNEIMICAGSTSGLRYNAARGDSGGALIIKQDDQYYFAGVVSWGDPDDDNYKLAHPAAFARVSAVENWIFSIVSANDEAQ